MGRCMSKFLPTGRGEDTETHKMEGNGDEFYDVAVCRENEIGEGQVKDVKLDGTVGCLLVKQNGVLSAIGNKCSHFGAPLAKGSLGEGRIRCPFHGACFNVITGDIEDFPGLDSLQRYDVTVGDDGLVRVRAKKSLAGGVRVKPIGPVTNDDAVVVIVGGGASAQLCAETLRTRPDNPWSGRIVMLSEETERPYDRTKLSKALTTTAEAIALRKREFYEAAKIELKNRAKIVKVDTKISSVESESGDVYKYDYLVLATGGKPRTIDVEGYAAAVKSVFTLRSPKDANEIAARSENKKVVIVGSSFIGMEVAAYLVGRATCVTVVGRSETPFSAILGERIGKYLKAMHESKGVHFEMRTGPDEFVADGEGNLTHVVLQNGKRLEADVCILGLGVTPNTDYAKGSGLELTAQGHVIVDSNMRTNIDNVFAVGDIAAFPLELPTCKTVAAIGHWQIALNHGRTAGMNISSASVSHPVKTVPFFWSVQFGKSLRYAGYVQNGFDDVLYDGDVEAGKFAAFYLKDDIVVAVSSLMRDPVVADFANLLAEGNILKRGDLANEHWRNKYSLSIQA